MSAVGLTAVTIARVIGSGHTAPTTSVTSASSLGTRDGGLCWIASAIATASTTSMPAQDSTACPRRSWKTARRLASEARADGASRTHPRATSTARS